MLLSLDGAGEQAETNLRWIAAKNSRLGTVASSAPAASAPSCTCPSAPTNRASVSGSVTLAGSWIRTSAKKNSFHEEIMVNIAVATSPGASSGATMLTSTRTFPAPSTTPASSTSRGIAEM